jgi:hypothetical protein
VGVVGLETQLLSDLRKRAKSAKVQAQAEKCRLIEHVLMSQSQQAEDLLHAKIVEASEGLEQQLASSATRSKDSDQVVRLPVLLYDLRILTLGELQRSAQDTPDPYLNLRKQATYSFRDVDRWLVDELGYTQAERTSPTVWLDQLAIWIEKAAQTRGLKKLFLKRPKLPEALEALFQRCAMLKLKPTFERYRAGEVQGVALRVQWSQR